MITCQKATELLSKQMDGTLSLKEEVSLKLHLFICEFCEKFSQHIKIIRLALKGPRIDEEKVLRSNEDAKRRLKEKLKK